MEPFILYSYSFYIQSNVNNFFETPCIYLYIFIYTRNMTKQMNNKKVVLPHLLNRKLYCITTRLLSLMSYELILINCLNFAYFRRKTSSKGHLDLKPGGGGCKLLDLHSFVL